MNPLQLGRSICGDFEQAAEHEWLVTNGIGGYASGTVAEANTRRYHGLLIAALEPPAARMLLVAKIDAIATYRGEPFPLSSNEFRGGTIAPHGYRHLDSFHLDTGTPVWRYALADAILEKRVLMAPGRNATYLQFHLLRGDGDVELQLLPLCAYRDMHVHGHGGDEFVVHPRSDGFRIEPAAGALSYQVTCEGSQFRMDPDWYWNFEHRVERRRGLDAAEDLFRPGWLTLRLGQDEQATVVVSAEPEAPAGLPTVKKELDEHRATLIEILPANAPPWIRQLALAADQFIVQRRLPAGGTGRSVIAGYPWFTDWGRDTMIALTGLTLVPRRFDVAAEILRTFGAHLSEGMLPNWFPGDGAPPEYNSVDAALWYIHALQQYTLRIGDRCLATELYPVVTEIIDCYRQGTRHGIHVDPADGLLSAGADGVQLTWMDAKVGNHVVTPRSGKAVEVNALWYNALKIGTCFAELLGDAARSREYCRAAAQTWRGYQRFWNPSRHCLHDVIDVPAGGTDSSLRPNQILAVALHYSPLDSARQRAVVDCCARHLLTCHGLRSLAPGEPDYAPHYDGGPEARDRAYHQGTVWAWLIGPFVHAHYRVYRDAALAQSFLEPFGRHLASHGLGTISEIFDADPPHAPHGCFAQAWSVAEVLRAWYDLNEPVSLVNPR